MEYKKIQAIIFDFDGVVFDSEALHLAAGNKALEPYNVYIEPKVYIEKYIGISDIEVFPKILMDYQMAPDQHLVSELVKQKRHHYFDFLKNKTAFESVKGLEDFLKKIISTINHIAICSNANKSEIQEALQKLNEGRLNPYFKFITAIDELHHGKPSPEGYLLTAKLLGIDPQGCLVFEDTPIGIRAAKAAGMTVIGLSTTHLKEKLSEADAVFEHFSDPALSKFFDHLKL
jgi:beta-phosphoglucomutase